MLEPAARTTKPPDRSVPILPRALCTLPEGQPSDSSSRCLTMWSERPLPPAASVETVGGRHGALDRTFAGWLIGAEPRAILLQRQACEADRIAIATGPRATRQLADTRGEVEAAVPMPAARGVHDPRVPCHGRKQTPEIAYQLAPSRCRNLQPLQDGRCIRRRRASFAGHRLACGPVQQLQVGRHRDGQEAFVAAPSTAAIDARPGFRNTIGCPSLREPRAVRDQPAPSNPPSLHCDFDATSEPW